MEAETLLDIVTDLGYRLAMCGAETYRVEESINRILTAYGYRAEAFVIPNCMIISLGTADGQSLTRMRRIGHHGSDLDAVEHYSGLSRRICGEVPEEQTLRRWLAETEAKRKSFNLPSYLIGSGLGAMGFSVLFGATWLDCLWAFVCGLLVGLVNHTMEKRGANPFFRIITAAFVMSVPAYSLGAAGWTHNPDSVIIGALMILVPGLLFTNAMRDIIYGDTNSGINRVVQVLLIAMAIALGTAAAWNVSIWLWGAIPEAATVSHTVLIQCIGCFIGCIGFSILFNIHGPGGLLCTLGGVLTWLIYLGVLHFGGGDLTGYFWATLFAAAYAEVMARIRKYPAISYLVVSIFPLIPGAGVYYSMCYAVRGQLAEFSNQGIHTAAIAGIMAVAILLVSTSVRLLTVKKRK